MRQARPVPSWAAIEICSRLVGRDNEVTIFWVPAHVSIPGNEEADRLVKEAAGAGPRQCWTRTDGRPISLTSPEPLQRDAPPPIRSG